MCPAGTHQRVPANQKERLHLETPQIHKQLCLWERIPNGHPGGVTSPTRPFLKWVGGKQYLLPEILKRLPPKVGNYWEPFLGAGAVFFGLANMAKQAVLSDINADLVNAFVAVRDHPNDLIGHLREHVGAHSKQHYLEVRQRPSVPLSCARSAARFIYLNKAGYNGLYRVNRQGDINVAFGRHPNPNICDVNRIGVASAVLRHATLRTGDFTEIVPTGGDFVYCDPPYHATHNRYTAFPFNAEDQHRLADTVRQWAEQGVNVMVSNSDAPLIREIYEGFRFSTVKAPRLVNLDVTKRGLVPELIVTTYDHGIPDPLTWQQPRLGW